MFCIYLAMRKCSVIKAFKIIVVSLPATILITTFIRWYLHSLVHGVRVDLKVLNLPQGVAFFDDLASSSDARHKIWYALWVPPSSSKRIGLVTQCTSSHLYELANLVKVWHHPISVAVFTTGDDLLATLKIVQCLISCNQAVASLVTVSLVLPTSHPPYPGSLSLFLSSVVASSPLCSHLPKNSSGENYAEKNIPYPVNLLRNVAIKVLETEFILVLDIDMLPSEGLYHQVLSSKKLERQGVGLVLPSFELRKGAVVPKGKVELLKTCSRGEARPFYVMVCWKCHGHTDYDRWISLPADEISTYPVPWRDPWEPLYITRKENVAYDERFEQYGFNRISQLCDLHMRGVELEVFNPGFVIHNGFKESHGFHGSKDEENDRNRILYRAMKKELLLKYPGSGRQC